jgi:hypothetical protein
MSKAITYSIEGNYSSDEEIKVEIQALNNARRRINGAAQADGRELAKDEKELVNEISDTIEKLEKRLPGKPLTVENGYLGDQSGRYRVDSKPFALRRPEQVKDFYSLFGKDPAYTWEDNSTDFFGAGFSGRHHPGLIKAAMSETRSE